MSPAMPPCCEFEQSLAFAPEQTSKMDAIAQQSRLDLIKLLADGGGVLISTSPGTTNECVTLQPYPRTPPKP